VRNAKSPPVADLFNVLTYDGRVDRRLATARVLGALENPQITARLNEMLVHDRGARDALAVLLCSSQPAAAAMLASARQSPALRAIARSVESQLVAEP
jgi:hypothetical protein